MYGDLTSQLFWQAVRPIETRMRTEILSPRDPSYEKFLAVYKHSSRVDALISNIVRRIKTSTDSLTSTDAPDVP